MTYYMQVMACLSRDNLSFFFGKSHPHDTHGSTAMISRATLARVKKGVPQVALGIYATVLFILGLDKRLADLADIRFDEIGLRLEEDRLPKKIYLPRRKRASQP